MKFKSFLLSIVLLLIGSFHLVSYAQENASLIKYLSRGADVIMIGKVTKQNSSWNQDKTRIYTKATLQVDEYLKGSNTGKSVEVIYPGGEVGEIGELYTHMPRFINDEEVLVFLERDKGNSGYKVFNGEDGKFTVINDKKTGEKVTSSYLKVKNLKEQIKGYLQEK